MLLQDPAIGIRTPLLPADYGGSALLYVSVAGVGLVSGKTMSLFCFALYYF